MACVHIQAESTSASIITIFFDQSSLAGKSGLGVGAISTIQAPKSIILVRPTTIKN